MSVLDDLYAEGSSVPRSWKSKTMKSVCLILIEFFVVMGCSGSNGKLKLLPGTLGTSIEILVYKEIKSWYPDDMPRKACIDAPGGLHHIMDSPLALPRICKEGFCGWPKAGVSMPKVLRPAACCVIGERVNLGWPPLIWPGGLIWPNRR